MKKIEWNLLLLVLNVLIFIFFIGFIYFSYFTAKELLVVKYIKTDDYSYKFNSWEVQECNDMYSYKYVDIFNQTLWEDINNLEKREKLFNEIKVKCLNNIEVKSENKKIADFKYNFIKYWLATLFFFILFIVFSLQNLAIYRSEKKESKVKKSK